MANLGVFGPVSGSIVDGRGYAGAEFGVGYSATYLSGSGTVFDYEPIYFIGNDFGCFQ
jgi:hypothetical protein